MEYSLEQEIELDLIPSLLLAEADHMPASLYIAMGDFSLRDYTVSLILQATKGAHVSLPYLAINYLDRFLSFHRAPELKPCVMNLIAVSCISLAMKMTDIGFLPSMHGVVSDWSMVAKMEIVILGALKWRMRSITPFSFLNFLLSLFKFDIPPLREAVKARAVELITMSQKGIDLIRIINAADNKRFADAKMMRYKPSIIAASAVLRACREVFPMGECCFTKSTFHFEFVNVVEVFQCFQEMKFVGETTGAKTPESVLEHMFTFDRREN